MGGEPRAAGAPTSPGASLADVAGATASRRRALNTLQDAEDEWRFTVGAAVEAGRPAAEVAEVAEVGTDEVQRIHDGM